MSATIDLTQAQIQEALRGFLLLILPGVDTQVLEIVEGQDNRVPEPKTPDFVVLTPTRRERLATNINDYVDAKFTGSIAGTVLTVTFIYAIGGASIKFPRRLFGVGIAANTVITGQLTGPAGGIGTYSVSVSQTVSSETMAAGANEMLQKTKILMQCDVHGPNSAENTQIFSTAFRDAYACDQIAALNPLIQPLYMEEPKQLPFLNEGQQYEFRWVCEAWLQANITVSVPQEFADSVVVGLIEVDTTYPP